VHEAVLLVNGRPAVSNPLTGSQFSGSPAFAFLDRGTPPCCDVMLSVHFVTMTLMSELPAGDTHDVIVIAARW